MRRTMGDFQMTRSIAAQDLKTGRVRRSAVKGNPQGKIEFFPTAKPVEEAPYRLNMFQSEIKGMVLVDALIPQWAADRLLALLATI
jgi:hypothetical protein